MGKVKRLSRMELPKFGKQNFKINRFFKYSECHKEKGQEKMELRRPGH